MEEQLDDKISTLFFELEGNDFQDIYQYTISREECLEGMQILKKNASTTFGHIAADRLLLLLIGDAEIAKAFEDLDKWYG